LVGGTHYYTQALLFKDHIIEQDDSAEKTSHPVLQEPTETILAKLREVDPVMADRWHPNDRRKIQRSLEIWLTTGKPASETYVEKLAEKNTSAASGNGEDAFTDETGGNALRFPTLVFWVYASKEVLPARLDARVLKMTESGLLDEVKELDEFQIAQARNNAPVDRARGIWVSIGYKEFEAYQTALRAGDDDVTTTGAELSKLRELGVEQTQAATRQYAKRQIRWIRIKLLNALSRASATPTTFLLDGSDISQWDASVKELALDLAKKFLRNEQLPDPRTTSDAAREMLEVKSDDLSHRPDLWARKTCEACGVAAATPAMWDMHIKSRGHRHATSARKARDYSQFTKEKKEKPSSCSVEDALMEPLDIFTDESLK
jgi:tRNA dimethylallyltransferase